MRWMIGAIAALCLCGSASAMTLTSADFKDGAALPEVHVYPRCGGQNISPELSWSGAPAGTTMLVLTMIDVTVKPNGWSHWVVVNLPENTTSLPRGVTVLPAPATTVTSNFGDNAYAGPCPPPGTGTHRYEFTVWAIPNSALLTIRPDMPATDLTNALTSVASDHAKIGASVAAK